MFRDRFHAGELLAEMLGEYRGREDTLILTIPAGGVQVASVVVDRLGLPIDIAVTRKLHIPWNPEAGFGAVSWDGYVLLNEPLVGALGLTDEQIKRCIALEKEVVAKRLRLFRGHKPLPDLRGKTVIIVDDGLASGFSMLATARTLSKSRTRERIVAIPTAPRNAIELLRSDVERIYCLNIRSGPRFAVADAYEFWYDLGDEEVVRILEESQKTYQSKKAERE